MKEFISAIEENENEENGEDSFVEFKLDGRVMRAYQPDASQLTFLLAALGRGQRNEQRFANIVNIMMSSLREDDADYFEARLLERDPRRKISLKTMEEVFEYIIEQWFGDPTQSPSGSVHSEPPAGEN